jgi:hypothetical protein
MHLKLIYLPLKKLLDDIGIDVIKDDGMKIDLIGADNSFPLS